MNKLSKQNKIIAFIVLILVILSLAGYFIFSKQPISQGFLIKSSSTVNTTIRYDIKLSNTISNVWFNENKIDNSNLVVAQDGNNTYLSKEILKKYYNTNLENLNNKYVLKIRRADVTLKEIVKYNNTYYIPLDLISDYVAFNKHLLLNGNNLMLNNVLPENVSYKGKNYSLHSGETSDGQIKPKQKAPNATLIGINIDGRGIFQDDDKNSILVEDDYGNLWAYSEPPYSIN